MERLITLGVANAVAATALALVVGLLSRRLRGRPGWLHCLWLLVLMKLVTPPLFEVPLLRVPERVAAAPAEVVEVALPAATAALALEPVSVVAEAIPAATDPEPIEIETIRPLASFSPVEAFRAVWPVGTVLILLLAAVRIARFHSLLRLAEPAPDEVQEQVHEMGRRLGLARLPVAWLIDAPLPPMLWAVATRPRLLLPAELWKRLDSRQRRLLLVHELAHLKRGDHLVRLFELAVTAGFWWLPTVWWARKALRDAEEDCCDAWVVWAFPDDAREYAETLLETVDFLTPSRSAVPLLASGFGGAHHLQLQRRLTMIMQGTTPRRLGLTGALGAFGLSACLLPVAPGWAQTPAEKSSSQAITIELKTDDDARPEKEVKADVKVGIAVDGDVQEVKADSVAKAIDVLRKRIDELAKDKGGAKEHEAQIKALKQAIAGLEKARVGTFVIRKMEGPAEAATAKKEARSVIVLKKADSKDQARIEKAKARIAALHKELVQKQKELAEANLDLAKLAGAEPQLVVHEVAPEFHVIGKPGNKEEVQVVRGRLFNGAGQTFEVKVDPASPGGKDHDRIEALEKKLSRLLQEVEGLRKQREGK